ncbi:hypothetical protein TUM4630_24470 [Shewanella algidipiscicola]|uniref:Uncharacterized protein n=1 Tax=Shewanella algidipiscicola TaxID=614070 RepID=A0ABQ4PKD0_9GAMM|nr:hypothetical protein TUM4630_24470 [Shewanella algidipiscicola]
MLLTGMILPSVDTPVSVSSNIPYQLHLTNAKYSFQAMKYSPSVFDVRQAAYYKPARYECDHQLRKIDVSLSK